MNGIDEPFFCVEGNSMRNKKISFSNKIIINRRRRNTRNNFSLFKYKHTSISLPLRGLGQKEESEVLMVD